MRTSRFAPRRQLNPLLLRRVERCERPKHLLALLAGYPFYTSLFETLHAEKVRATPQAITRLERLADVLGFPKDEIFLDEAAR